MFPRGRQCLKRCGLSAPTTTFDHAATRTVADEPLLLFLYPHWFRRRHQQQQRRPISSSSSSVHVNSSGRTLRRDTRRPLPHRKQSFGASSRRWISGGSLATESKSETGIVSGTGTRVGTEGIGDSLLQRRQQEEKPEYHGEKDIESKSASAVGQAQDELTANMRDDHGGFNPFAGPESGGELKVLHMMSRSRRRLSDMFRDFELERTQKNSRDRQTKMERPAAAIVPKLSTRDQRKLRNRAYYVEGLEGLQPHPRTKQWDAKIRTLLERLSDPDKKDSSRGDAQGEKRKTILIPEHTLALLAGVSDASMAENIWYVPLRHGCRVHVLPPSESKGIDRKAVLSGSAAAVSEVVNRIKHVQELQERGDPLVDIRKPVIPVFPSARLSRRKPDEPRIRGVWDTRSGPQGVLLDLILDRSERVSTVREFAEHVEELTISLPSKHAIRGKGNQPLPHSEQVAAVLMALFKNEKNQFLISTAALNSALEFLLEHELITLAKELFLIGQAVVTVDTFNILLKSAAERQSLPFFLSALPAMTRMGIRPNSMTWLAYLNSLISPGSKARFIKSMERKGLLQEPRALRSALQLTIHDTLTRHLASGGTVDEFFNKTIKTAWLNWFSPSLVHQMFNAIVHQKNLAALDRMVEICKECNMDVPISPTISQIALLFRRDFYSILNYLFLLSPDAKFNLSKQACERLFLIAFKAKHYNICRVLWTYACINGTVTFQMKDAVLFSLTQNIGRKDLPEQETLWRTSAGKVIVGFDLRFRDYPLQTLITENFPREFHQHPVSYLVAGSKLEGEEREKQRRAARMLIQRDIEVGSWYSPKYPLMIMLEAAAEMDREWEGVPRHTKWLMQNAIRVPVVLSI
ncbi:hypothetical protein ARAM_006349 [Aspergillus rambellii]|uniref:Uncharacterized protein n=1 Tax=Aspergillus rambellii TaxID=308745 RepID=A0A0F8VUT4_9EURO|nr:hypothetical protein ARAM_006349 [Aspergillus rambellii]